MIDLVLQGTTIEKGKIAVFNNAHAYLIYHSLLSEAKRDAKEAWANPFPTTGPSDEQVALAISHAEVTRKREEAVAVAKFVAASAAATAASAASAESAMPAELPSTPTVAAAGTLSGMSDPP